MSGFLFHLLTAGRALARRPGYTFLVVATLTIGIASSAAVFSVFYSVLLAPLPFAEPERLAVVLWGENQSPAAPAEYLEWRRQTRSFEEMAAVESWGPSLTGEGDPEKLQAVRISPQMFELLGRSPRLGRTFSGGESDAEAADQVVLSHALWQRRFGGDQSVIGTSIQLDERPFEVVGVADPEFRFPTFWTPSADLWAPLRFSPEAASNRFGSSLRVIGRLAPSASRTSAQAEMTTITRALATADPEMRRSEQIHVGLLHEATVGGASLTLALIAGCGAALLLIACVNTAALMFVRTARRGGEIAVRQALGAGRAALAAPLAAEGLLLWLAAAAAGALLADLGVDALLALLPPAAQRALPRRDEIEVGLAALGVAYLASATAVGAFSILPALRARAGDVANKLRQSGRGLPSTAPGRILVIAQIALATGLVGAGVVLVDSMRRQLSVDPGFRPERTLSALIPTARAAYSSPGRRTAFYSALVENLAERTGVEAVSLVNHIPLAGDRWGLSFVVEGQPEPAGADYPTAAYRVSAPGYFRAIGGDLVDGRDFVEQDSEDAPQVVIVNRTLARNYFGDRSAVGERIRIGRAESGGSFRQIVGVVEDIAQSEWNGAPANEVYIPFRQDETFRDSNRFPMTLVVRTAGDPRAMASVVRDEVRRLDPDLPVAALETMPAVVRNTLWRPRMTAAAVTSFAFASLGLAAVGVFGVLSFAVALRTNELGLRAALGAAPQQLQRMVLREAWAFTAFGCAIGIGGAAALSGTWSELLYEVRPLDPTAVAASIAALLGIVTLAAWAPARRAARIDPLRALRDD